jgi:AbrB family looped-hinge helix DNA binding protein
METVSLSSKGQLVIPKAVRDSAKISSGSVLEVRYEDGEIRLRPVAPAVATTLEEVSGCLAKPGRKPRDAAETRAAIKARLKTRNAP